MNDRSYFVYIICNEWDTVFYIGVTNDLFRRISEHRLGSRESFSKRYHLTKLVYFEETDDIYAALTREKQLKNWHRAWKINLIKQINPTLKDLYEDLFGDGDAETSSA